MAGRRSIERDGGLNLFLDEGWLVIGVPRLFRGCSQPIERSPERERESVSLPVGLYRRRRLARAHNYDPLVCFVEEI